MMVQLLALAMSTVMMYGAPEVQEIPREQENIIETIVVCPEEEEGCFCDGHELTNKERCEELLIKILIDTQNALDDGLIIEETYDLNIRLTNEALDYLETACEEEADILYKVVLLLNMDWLESDIEAGKEIDEGFYDYIEEELKRIK